MLCITFMTHYSYVAQSVYNNAMVITVIMMMMMMMQLHGGICKYIALNVVCSNQLPITTVGIQSIQLLFQFLD